MELLFLGGGGKTALQKLAGYPTSSLSCFKECFLFHRLAECFPNCGLWPDALCHATKPDWEPLAASECLKEAISCLHLQLLLYFQDAFAGILGAVRDQWSGSWAGSIWKSRTKWVVELESLGTSGLAASKAVILPKNIITRNYQT